MPSNTLTSRRDCELIARLIRELNMDDRNREKVAHSFARNLAQTNPRFNHDRFVDACWPRP